jgi:hypothetical protein
VEFGPRATYQRKGNPAKECGAPGGTHHNVYINGGQVGSILCCPCCDDSGYGLPEGDFGCKVQ